MKKKLFLYAFITSPILALYGVAPIYIFKVLKLNEAGLLFIGLMITVLMLWGMNIFILIKIKPQKKWMMYLFSLFAAFLSYFPKIFFEPNFPFVSKIEQFILYPFVLSIAITIIILIICNSLIVVQNNDDAKIEISGLKIENLEAQKQVLMQQLQPHFLFNSLSVLKSLIKENADLAETYAIKLSDFLRYSVESHKEELIILIDELQFVNNYIELQKVRFENAFYFVVNIPSEVLQKKIPVFSLQTLVENAFKHNYFTEKRPLTITVSYDDGMLKVCNNKVSIKLVEGTATGLTNLNRRYQLITGQSIEIKDTEDTFCVMISLIEK